MRELATRFDVRRWTVVLPLLVYAAWIVPWLDFVPVWDGTIYYDCIRNAIIGPSVHDALFCQRHLTITSLAAARVHRRAAPRRCWGCTSRSSCWDVSPPRAARTGASTGPPRGCCSRSRRRRRRSCGCCAGRERGRGCPITAGPGSPRRSGSTSRIPPSFASWRTCSFSTSCGSRTV